MGPVQRDDEGVTTLFHQRVGARLLVCWGLTILHSHGYRLSVDEGHQLVKKCNTF